MADISDINAAQSVKIIGSDATGLETNPVNADSSGNLQTVVKNGTGSSAVNIQDGGNSITVDGSVSVSNFPATQNVAITSSVEVEVKNDTGNPVPVSDISNNGGLQGSITVGTSAIQAMVGVSPLSSRKNLTVFNNSSSDIYWGYTNAVTTSTGTPLFKNQLIDFQVGPSTTVWLIAGSAGNNVRVTENA